MISNMKLIPPCMVDMEFLNIYIVNMDFTPQLHQLYRSICHFILIHCSHIKVSIPDNKLKISTFT